MQSHSSQPETIAITESEAYQTLLARARRRTGGVSAERIVRHVLSVTQGGDWPIQRDALEAVLRRCASTHADEIRILGRPRSRLLGLYATRRRGSHARPYRTLLRRIEPFDGSCECADFLRSSLGLCKHLVAVLEDVVSKRRRVDIDRAPVPEPAPLRWDPIRPLTGLGDWIDRVRWSTAHPTAISGAGCVQQPEAAGPSRFPTRRGSGWRSWIGCSARSATATVSRHCTRCCRKSTRGSPARPRPRAPGSACAMRCTL